MGPGPQPGHRAQLSPEWSVKDTTTCPAPNSTIARPSAPILSERTTGYVSPMSM